MKPSKTSNYSILGEKFSFLHHVRLKLIGSVFLSICRWRVDLGFVKVYRLDNDVWSPANVMWLHATGVDCVGISNVSMMISQDRDLGSLLFIPLC